MAGFHLPEGTPGRAVVGRYRAALAADARCMLLARREQGLMYRRELPRPPQGLRELATRRLLFINRQPGSGTRVLLDCLLATAGVAPEQIRGYDSAEFTHMAVAAMVASGTNTRSKRLAASRRPKPQSAPPLATMAATAMWVNSAEP